MSFPIFPHQYRTFHQTQFFPFSAWCEQAHCHAERQVHRPSGPGHIPRAPLARGFQVPAATAGSPEATIALHNALRALEL